MSEVLAQLKKSGRKGATFYTFGVDSLRNVTNTSPLVIYGNFSKVTKIQTTGQYYYLLAGQYQYYNTENVTLGTTMKIMMGYNNGYTSYRNITVFADRIVIGAGYYDNNVASDYGTLLTLIALSDDDIVSY